MTLRQPFTLELGTLEETVTVTGESPIVDVQSARHEQVLSNDVAQALPSARSVNSLIEFMPGVTGAPAGDTPGQVQLTPTMTMFATHGGNVAEGRMLVDGVSVGSSRGGGGQSVEGVQLLFAGQDQLGGRQRVRHLACFLGEPPGIKRKKHHAG